ncbi:MAG TPA: thioredoxin domain-containing protein [Pirellulales bacterium]|jgi:thiol-disulfide isomerase/thioredoxin|nr:thioredoxin domain-containing protein [Pirellulales bacterium]
MNLAFLAAAMISLAAPGDSTFIPTAEPQAAALGDWPISRGGEMQFVQLGYAPTGDTMLLDFGAEWCGFCRQMSPVVGSIQAEGYPVRRVNVDQERALANRFGVQGLPCFIMLVNGKEVDRVEGATDRNRLMAMFTRNGVGPAVNAARGQSPGMVATSGAAIPFPPTQPASASPGDPNVGSGGRFVSRTDTLASNGTFSARNSAIPQYNDQRNDPRDNLPVSSPMESTTSLPQAYDALLRASVRLRIEDETGISRGSGTIIDSRQGEALIITCGHMFREAAKDGKIWVDLFGPGAPQGVAGKVIDYDLNSEVGLIRIATKYPLTAARLAPAGYVVRAGDKVISMGCDGGADATPRETRVTSINRYAGAANLQVAFQPVQGRSGGGLFTPEGWVVGVCFAADPIAGEGLFSALPTLCAELDHVGLSFVYTGPSAEGVQLAAGGRQPRHSIETAQVESQSFDGKRYSPDGGNVMRDRQVQLTGQIQSVGVTPTALSDRGGQQLSPDELAALQAISHETEGAEVICIVRPQGNPQGASEFIVINHASPALLEQLTAQQSPATERR